MIDGPTEIVRCHGMDLNVCVCEGGGAEILRMRKQPFPLQIMTDQKQRGSMEYLNCLVSMIANHARCRRNITSRIAVGKVTLNYKKHF
jgi:hypothetical protein